jgi:hypothetical protein
MEKLLKKLKSDFPSLVFIQGSQCRWSPANQTITFVKAEPDNHGVWALFHELAHAELGHQTYKSDIELLLMEVAAWQKAKELADSYEFDISDTHIQDCLDTYRDWLDRRSTCPSCGHNALPASQNNYSCLNCQTTWRVSGSRFCRPYRLRTTQTGRQDVARPHRSTMPTFQ